MNKPWIESFTLGSIEDQSIDIGVSGRWDISRNWSKDRHSLGRGYFRSEYAVEENAGKVGEEKSRNDCQEYDLQGTKQG
jgi:hypothetical protein